MDALDDALAANAEVFALLAEAMGGETRTLDAMTFAASGSPIWFFNQGVARGHLSDPSGTIGAAIEFFESKKLGFMLSLMSDDEAANGAAEAAGLSFAHEMPVMVWDPVDRAALRAEADGLLIRPLVDDDLTIQLSEDGPLEAFAILMRALMRKDGVTVLTGEAEGRVVARSMAFTRGDLVGIYSVATAPSVRRRGFGEAMTAAAIIAGLEAGATSSFLLASDMGRPIYERMGFRTVAGQRFAGRGPTPSEA